MSDTTLLTTDEAAARLRVAPYTVRDWAKAGTLRGSKPGKSWLFDPAEVEALLESAENKPRPTRRRRRRDTEPATT